MASKHLGGPRASVKPSASTTKRRASLVAVITAIFMFSSVAALASVSTDQDDYAPGSVVTISGDNGNGVGYLAGESVVVDVSGPNGYTASCEGVADDYGAWACQVLLWDSELAEGDYSYVAVGQSSGVSETGSFTDHGPSPVTDDNYTMSANASHVLSFSVELGGGSSSVTLTAAVVKIENVTDTGTTDISLTSPGTSTGNGVWTGSLQGACGKTYKINNVKVTWHSGHDHDSTETPASNEGTSEVTTNSCAPSNSAPSVTAASFSPNPVDCQVSTTLSYTFSDPDNGPWTAHFDWENDGTFDESVSGLTPPGTYTRDHTYAAPGSYTAAVKVVDSLGAESNVKTAAVTVNQTYTATWYQPIDPATNTLNSVMVNKTKLGRVVPLKASIVDGCTGYAVNGSSGKDVSLKVYETNDTGQNVLTDAIEQYVDAGQANNNTFCFRWIADESFWLHNFDTSNKGNFALQVGKTYKAEVGVANDAGADGIATCTRTDRVFADPDAYLKMMK